MCWANVMVPSPPELPWNPDLPLLDLWKSGLNPVPLAPPAITAPGRAAGLPAPGPERNGRSDTDRRLDGQAAGRLGVCRVAVVPSTGNGAPQPYHPGAAARVCCPRLT